MGEVSIIDIIRPGTTRALDFVLVEELQKRTGIVPREILKFALAELLCNALDKEDATEIGIDLQFDGGFYRLSVSDNGGKKLTAEEVRLIFDFEKKASSQSTLRPSIQLHGSGERFCEEIGRPCFFTQVDTEVKDWLFELQDDQRLDIALKAFKAIDKQMQIGADVREVVGQVLREIRTDFGNVKDAMDRSVKEYLKDIVAQAKASKEETENFIKQNIIHSWRFLLSTICSIIRL